MTKKILAAVVAVVMVMALSVSVFATDILTDDVRGVAKNENVALTLPEDLVLDNGAVITLHVKGTAENTMVRFYLTDASDNGRVMEVFEVTVNDGAFDETKEFTIDTTGAIQGTTAPAILMVKGPDYQTPPANLVLEVVELTVAGEEAAAPAAEDNAEATEPDTTATEPDTTTTEPETTTTPETTTAPETTKAPATGIALAVVPAVIALAAVAVSKKH